MIRNERERAIGQPLILKEILWSRGQKLLNFNLAFLLTVYKDEIFKVETEKKNILTFLFYNFQNNLWLKYLDMWYVLEPAWNLSIQVQI